MNQIPNIEEIEALSEKIHHLYCAQYEKDNGEPYWTKGDYSKLDERTKEYDRNIARFIHHQLQKARAEERERIKEIIGTFDYEFLKKPDAQEFIGEYSINWDRKRILDAIQAELDQDVSSK